MRDVLNELNKKSISDATGISYARLRRFAAGAVNDLTPEEINKIKNYLLTMAEKFNETPNSK